MLVRPAPVGFAVYMIRRSTKSRFMPSVHVFPGGAVDLEDRSPLAFDRLRGHAEPPGDEFAIAALRELFEEAGVLLACDERAKPAALGPAEIANLRGERAAGANFTTMLARYDVWLDARELTYYSNWVTPLTEKIRFDAHFFLAHAPENQIAEADAVEVHDGEWIAPSEALERARRGDFAIIFPTRKHLERLAAFDNIDALFAHARARSVHAVRPIEGAAGGAFDVEDDDSW